MTTRRFQSRWALLAVAAALGATTAVASASAGNYGQAVFGLVLITAVGAFLSFSRSEWAVAQTGAADERQKSLNEQAIIYAYYAVLFVVIVGFFLELARDEAGPFTLIGSVGGFTHMIALAVLRRRR